MMSTAQRMVLALLPLLAAVLLLLVLDSTDAASKLPFPYYQRPPYRYPYYDSTGNGHLYYGYGGSELYTYNKFTPLEGIYRR